MPSAIKTELADKLGGKIVSYEMISFPSGGGSETLVFPDDFTGINGVPSTGVMGEYEVIFVYLSWEGSGDGRCCCIIEKEFDCASGSWFVTPEVPLGTIMVLIAPMAALIFYKFSRKT